MSVEEIETLITETQDVIATNSATLDAIGSLTFADYTTTNRTSNQNYSITVSGLTPNGLYTGSISLEAQINASGSNPEAQTTFVFVDSYLNVVQNGYVSTRATLYTFDGGPYGTYQQLFFSVLANGSGNIIFNYMFQVQQHGGASGTSTYNINQNFHTKVIRLCRIR
jgi:hypothetical protein